jgi:predicted adenine nucleotide alpha hydrolase (AANH) superfamily ATPase
MKKQKEMIVFFYNPNKTKYCKITVNSITEKEVEVLVVWKNTKDYDEDELWYQAAKTYIRNIKPVSK